MAASGNAVNIQPFATAVAIIMSDVTIYGGTGNPAQFDAFMTATSGTLVIVDLSGNTATLTVNGGTVYYIKATKYNATGSTATGLVGLRW